MILGVDGARVVADTSGAMVFDNPMRHHRLVGTVLLLTHGTIGTLALVIAISIGVRIFAGTAATIHLFFFAVACVFAVLFLSLITRNTRFAFRRGSRYVLDPSRAVIVKDDVESLPFSQLARIVVCANSAFGQRPGRLPVGWRMLVAEGHGGQRWELFAGSVEQARAAAELLRFRGCPVTEL